MSNCTQQHKHEYEAHEEQDVLSGLAPVYPVAVAVSGLPPRQWLVLVLAMLGSLVRRWQLATGRLVLLMSQREVE